MKILLTLSLLLLLSGCSVGMAMSGRANPNLTNVRAGASQAEIEIALGLPVEVTTNSKSETQYIYEYMIGDQPSGGRAVGHAIMDLLTLGGWELIGTPIEGFQGEKHRLSITYDENQTVKSMKVVRDLTPVDDDEDGY